MRQIKELIAKRKIRYRRVLDPLDSSALLFMSPEELAATHPNDLAALLEDLPVSRQVEIFHKLDDFHAAQVLGSIEEEQQLSIARAFGLKRLTHLLENMPSDRTADLLNKFPPEKIEELLELMEEDDRFEAIELLSYAEDSAGGVMVKELVDFFPDETVGEAIDILRKEFEPHDFITYLYVTSRERELLGVVSLKELILSCPSTALGDIMTTDVISVSLHEDQEKIAWLSTKYSVQAIPVVDSMNRLVGLVTPQDIAEIIQEEHEEDVYRMAGLSEEGETATGNPVRSAFYRFPWLFLTMGAGILASGIINSNTHADQIWLLSFATLICGLAGNVAVQTSTVVIRSLSQNQFSPGIPFRQILREIWAGLILACLCALTVGVIVSIKDQSNLHGLIVGCSVLSVICLAVTLSIITPNIFHRLNIDPAVASGPLVTTLTDLLGLSMYFHTAYWLLRKLA